MAGPYSRDSLPDNCFRSGWLAAVACGPEAQRADCQGRNSPRTALQKSIRLVWVCKVEHSEKFPEIFPKSPDLSPAFRSVLQWSNGTERMRRSSVLILRFSVPPTDKPQITTNLTT